MLNNKRNNRRISDEYKNFHVQYLMNLDKLKESKSEDTNILGSRAMPKYFNLLEKFYSYKSILIR